MNHEENVRVFFDNTAQYLHRNVGIFLRAQIVRDIIKTIKYKNILDIGCGDGSLSLQFLNESVQLTLVDLSKNMLNLCERKVHPELIQNVTFIQSDFLNFRTTEQYDLIICVGVLAHVSSIQSTMEKISSLLIPGGHCILQFSEQSNLINRILFLGYRLLRKFRESYHYPLNTIWGDNLLAIAKKNNLNLVYKQAYWTQLPGMSRLPSSISLRLIQSLRKNEHLSKLGGEKIWLFEKNETIINR